MNYLLDTNIFLWFIHGDRALPLKFKEYIEDKENDIFISQASLWEIAIKFSIGKLKLKRPFQDLIPGVLKENDFSVLLINTSHIIRVAELPLIHRDPFDRMIFSQSSVERIELIYTDPVFNQYISQPR
jgi:PIN domain nuclease of toxin-antitoxin system